MPVAETVSRKCMLMLSPWGVAATCAPDHRVSRLCLNGGSLQPEPICKFGRFDQFLNIPMLICDQNPFLHKTIHGRADNVRSFCAHAKTVPFMRTLSSRG